jgi:hypothetical protein
MLQLNPPIPVVTEKGDGWAYFLKEESMDHHVVWGVVLDDGGEIWWIENPQVKVGHNYTYGRSKSKITGKK